MNGSPISVLVRPSTEDDITAVAIIYGHYVRHSATFEIEPPDSSEMARRRSEIVTVGLPYLVAEWRGEVVAYAYASSYRPRPAYRFTIEDSVYVHPDHVGKGCGAALLESLIECCERGPWRQMIAVIGGSDNSASIRLHERFSFFRAGSLRCVGFKFNTWVDTVLMQRELGAGNGTDPLT
jgi:phosphinothricin acetyltransferase